MRQTFLTCKHCELVIKSQGHFTRNLKTCNKLNRARFECDICGERLQKKWLMRRHTLKHSNERNFRCTECGNGNKSKRNLTAHWKTHDKPYACSSDCQNFSAFRSLKVHLMEHRHGTYATEPEETFDCYKCDKSFSNPNYLKDHQRKVHDEKEAKCKVCEKSFRNVVSLRYHIQTHAKVECSVCSKMISKNWMASHLRSHASDFECDLCNYSCKAKHTLKDHVERHLLNKFVKDSKRREDFYDFELLKELQLKHPSYATSADKNSSATSA